MKHRTRVFHLVATVAITLAAAVLVPAPSLAATRPTLGGVASDHGASSGGEYVTLHGSGLTGTYVVAFGSLQTRHFHVWSSTEITVRAPAHSPGQVFVRVARPGLASLQDGNARYTYDDPAYGPEPLQPTGTQKPAPAVSTLHGAAHALTVDLSCAYGPVCGAVGDLGLATYDGASWSSVTSTPAGPETPLISCPVDGFCMAYSADGHRWRYQGGAWTDLGALPGVVALSCQKDRVCIAEAAHREYFYFSGAWGAAEDPVPGGVSGAACSISGCVVTSPTGYYRIRDVSTGTWRDVQPMYDSAALRSSSLTQGITGSLQCAYQSFCMSLGRPDGSGNEHFAIFTGHTWSIGQRHLTSLSGGSTGHTRLVDCASRTHCVEATYGTDSAGHDYRDWTVYEGTSRTTVSQTQDTRDYNAVSCGAQPYCQGIEYDTFGTLYGISPPPG